MQIITALFQQLTSSPGGLLVAVVVGIIAYYLEVWPNFPSRFVSVACLALGAILYPLTTKPTVVPADFPHPFVVLVLDGIILGFISMVVHAKLIKRFIDTNNNTPDSK